MRMHAPLRRYCRGQKKLDCPLCSVDDVYSLSYGARELTKKGDDEVEEEVVDDGVVDADASY